MSHNLPFSSHKNPVPVHVVFKQNVIDWGDALKGLDAAFVHTWLKVQDFSGARGELIGLPNKKGGLDRYVFGLGEKDDTIGLLGGTLSAKLKPGLYKLVGGGTDLDQLKLGFLLGAYQFDSFKSNKAKKVLLDDDGLATHVKNHAQAVYLARDLINRPANDLGPQALEQSVRDLGGQFKADVASIRGDDLLAQNFPMIHAVGRAAHEAPRLIELNWGMPDNPLVTLVGKGVTFDTGGLNIKPGNTMSLMKKDMGGAANIIGLAHLIMAANLKVRLKILVPAVENAISTGAFRPGDILPSRKGLQVEIGNTDAEGRLVLADALAYADEAAPECMIDMATLTGAARVALGPELPAMFTEDETFSQYVMQKGAQLDDPVWPLPLYQRYDRLLSSKQADVNHISAGPFAGAITAALFLRRFVAQAKSWSHFDIFAWAPDPREGRPFGGTDQGMRVVFDYLQNTYGSE